MGKKGDLSGFECELVVGAKRTSVFQKSVYLLGFSHTTINSVYRNNQKMENGQTADRKARITQITTYYSRSMQKKAPLSA